MGSATAEGQAANHRFAAAIAAAGKTETAVALACRAFDLDRFDVDVFNLPYRLLQTLDRLEELVDVIRESIIMAAEARDPRWCMNSLPPLIVSSDAGHGCRRQGLSHTLIA